MFRSDVAPGSSTDGDASPGLAPAADPTGPADEPARRLGRRLTAHLPGGRAEVELTDNRHTMISVRRLGGSPPAFRVRLHRMFTEADPATVHALARYVSQGDRRASALLGRFIDAHQDLVRESMRESTCVRTTSLRPAGAVHHLGALRDDLNARYFAGCVRAGITWGRHGGARPGARLRTLKLGSFHPDERVIRIHPVLDQPFVPRFFVQSVVFHEMLHEIHGMPVVQGRRSIHSPAFRADERRFEHHALAEAWERDNLERLLASR